MKRIKSIVLLLTISLGVLSLCIMVGCKEKKIKTARAKPVETPVKKLYVPFADEQAEESTGITSEPDDYLLEEPLEHSDENTEDDPNTYPEEEPNDEPDEIPEKPNDYPWLGPNDYPWNEPDYNWL